MPTVPDVELVSSWEEVDEAAQSIKNGLQKAQLAAGVRASLDKADTALQPSAQAAKTAAMTQPVGVDADGKLWTPPGGGGGGSGRFDVTLSYSGGTYSTDTSSSDIYSAWSAGYVVKARDNLGIEYDLQNISSSTATFFGIVDETTAFGGYTFTITGTTVTRYRTRVPVAPVPSGSDNGKVLSVANGAYALVEPSSDVTPEAIVSATGDMSVIEAAHTRENIGAGTYTKPDTGIPKTHLASDVQTSLNKADTALQTHQDISGKADISMLRHDYVIPAIPSTVYMRSSDTLEIYARNLLRPSYALELGQYTNATDIRAHDDYTVITPTSTGTKTIPYATFDEHMNQIDSKNFSLVIASTSPGTKTMLAIGDSFLTQNVLVQRIWARYSQAGGTLTTLGTKGTSQVNYEGYAGKTWTDFWNGFSGSPFGESGFSFSAYMTAQGYSAPDYVYIQLGTNDASPTRWSSEQDLSGIITAARGIVDNIHSYNSGIKIVLGLCVMPTLQGDKFAAKYNGTGWPWILRWNMQRLNKAIIDEFASDTNLRIAPVNLCLDSTADISDNVHPNTTGYNKMGDVVYSTMAGW